MLAWPTHMTKYVAPKCTLYCFLQGKVLAWPTHMTQYVAPKCTLYCFLQGEVLAGPTNMTKHVAPKCTLYCFLQGMVGGHRPCQKRIQNAHRGQIWIMRGHPAITVKLFLTWTAGVLAYGLVCAGPPDTMMATRRDCALVFDTDGGGRHVSRCVLSRARAHLAHAARAPHMARLARLEHAVHLAHVEHVAHLAHQACLARLGPSVARTGSVLVPSSCPSKDGR